MEVRLYRGDQSVYLFPCQQDDDTYEEKYYRSYA